MEYWSSMKGAGDGKEKRQQENKRAGAYRPIILGWRDLTHSSGNILGQPNFTCLDALLLLSHSLSLDLFPQTKSHTSKSSCLLDHLLYAIMSLYSTSFRLPSIDYPPAGKGYWGPVTSTINWCEEVRPQTQRLSSTATDGASYRITTLQYTLRKS